MVSGRAGLEAARCQPAGRRGGGTLNRPQRRRLRRPSTKKGCKKFLLGAELEAVADRAGCLPCHIQLGKWVKHQQGSHCGSHKPRLSNVWAGLVSEKDGPLLRSHCALTQSPALGQPVAIPVESPFCRRTGVLGLRRNRGAAEEQSGLQPACRRSTCVYLRSQSQPASRRGREAIIIEARWASQSEAGSVEVRNSKLVLVAEMGHGGKAWPIVQQLIEEQLRRERRTRSMIRSWEFSKLWCNCSPLSSSPFCPASLQCGATSPIILEPFLSTSLAAGSPMSPLGNECHKHWALSTN